jgi:hypothetical protein
MSARKAAETQRNIVRPCSPILDESCTLAALRFEDRPHGQRPSEIDEV